MAHTHITREDRYKIQAWLELDIEQEEMAERLGKSPSAISREIARNSNHNGSYTAGRADKRARERRKQCKRSSKKLLNDHALRKATLRLLKRKRSPEQIAGRRKRDHKSYVCHETLYQFIYAEQPDWGQYLRRRRSRYRRRHGTKDREKQREMEKKRWITDRPEHISNRSELGHWEGDTVHGRHESGYIGTYVERVAGYGMGIKLDTLEAEPLRQATTKRFRRLPRHKRRSTTNDNGKEFAEHELTERELGMTHYFALPYHSWERGTNENWNGLLREYFPKGTDFSTITQEDVDRVVRELNHRPRKRLNYLTPHEVFIKGLVP